MATTHDRSSSTPSKRRRKPVQVVECPPAFPGGDDWDARGEGAPPSGRRRRREPTAAAAGGVGGTTRGAKRGRGDDADATPVLDFHGAAREVRELGSSSFTGAQLRKHREDRYREIIGREVKKQKIPVKILWGMQRKKERKERAAAEEARASGVVSGAATGGASKWKRKEEEKRRGQKRAFEKRKNVSLYGPAPSVGFMKGGMLRVTKKK